MLTILTFVLSVSCPVPSVADFAKKQDPLKVEFSLDAIKKQECTAKQLEAENEMIGKDWRVRAGTVMEVTQEPEVKGK